MVSSGESVSVTSESPSFFTHFALKALPCPTFADSAPTAPTKSFNGIFPALCTASHTLYS